MNPVFYRKASAAFLALAIIVLAALPTCALERKVQRRVPPNYPELARRMHIEGSVRVEATVAPDGQVTSTKAVSGNPLLKSAAAQAIRKWKFVPEGNGSTENVEVDFRLGQ